MCNGTNAGRDAPSLPVYRANTSTPANSAMHTTNATTAEVTHSALSKGALAGVEPSFNELSSHAAALPLSEEASLVPSPNALGT